MSSAISLTSVDAQQTPERFDLERLLRVLRRRWWVIGLCLVLAAGSALGFSLAQRKEYTATASLLFRDPGLDQGILGTQSSSNTDPTREAATNVALVKSPAVAQRTANVLHGPLSANSIAGKMGITAEGQSNVISVAATDPSPGFAARLANTYARQFIVFRRAADVAKIRQVQSSVQSELQALPPDQLSSPAGHSLQTRVEQLDTLASLQTGNAELVQAAAAPHSPSSPKTKLNVAIGAVLGLLIGVGLALLSERLNRRLRGSDELGEMYSLPVLAEIPESNAFSLNGHAMSDEAAEGDREAFRMLHARLRYFNVDREIRSVLITSCTSQEGKSTVAWHLASVTAMSGRHRVLLVEADLRRPALALAHDLRPGPGLSDVLAEAMPFRDVIQQVELPAPADGAARPHTLDVITAGAVPPNPSELLESERMSEVLRLLTTLYDFIVLDSAPTLLVADPIPLMTQVGGVLVVSRIGSTTRDAAERLRDQLHELDAPVLGVIANRVKGAQSERYGYSYGYSYTDESLQESR